MLKWLKSRLFPEEPMNDINTALKHFRKGDFQRALRCANAILEEAPQVASSWRFKGECLAELGGYRQAEDCLRSAIELGGAGTEDLPAHIALLQYSYGDKQKAIETLREVVNTSDSPELRLQAEGMIREFEGG